MTEIMFNPSQIATLLFMQQGEITEYYIYKNITSAQKDTPNRELLTRIAEVELGHYGIWKRYTQKEVVLNTFHILFYYLIARVLGIIFAIKPMEGVEKKPRSYDKALMCNSRNFSDGK